MYIVVGPSEGQGGGCQACSSSRTSVEAHCNFEDELQTQRSCKFGTQATRRDKVCVSVCRIQTLLVRLSDEP